MEVVRLILYNNFLPAAENSGAFYSILFLVGVDISDDCLSGVAVYNFYLNCFFSYSFCYLFLELAASAIATPSASRALDVVLPINNYGYPFIVPHVISGSGCVESTNGISRIILYPLITGV